MAENGVLEKDVISQSLILTNVGGFIWTKQRKPSGSKRKLEQL